MTHCVVIFTVFAFINIVGLLIRWLELNDLTFLLSLSLCSIGLSQAFACHLLVQYPLAHPEEFFAIVHCNV